MILVTAFTDFPTTCNRAIMVEPSAEKDDWQEVAMGVVTLEIPENQVVEWIHQLFPTAKEATLRALIPNLDDLESLVSYGGERMRALC
jgi:hypothetical protein